MLSREALREATAAAGKRASAGVLASQRVEPVTPDDSVLTALRRLGAHDVEYLPVVSTRDGRRLIGIVSRHDLAAAYEKALSEELH